MRYDISMGIGEPKTNIDFAALKARLKASVDQSVDKAQSSPPVSPASEPKSSKPDTPRNRDRGNRRDGSFKANELEDLKKKGDLYISTMENVLTQTKSVEDLMVLVDSVPSKGTKKRPSLKLPPGLPIFLSLDRGFSQKFNGLIDTWEKRIVEVLFDDTHKTRFLDFMRDTLRADSAATQGDIFNGYLGREDLLILGEVPLVIVEMRKLWDQHHPIALRELGVTAKPKKKQIPIKKIENPGQEDGEIDEVIFASLVKALKNRKNPFKKDDKELVIEAVTSEQIVFRYRNNEMEGKWKILKVKSPQAKRFAEELQKNFGFELKRRKPSKKGENQARGTDTPAQPVADPVSLSPDSAQPGDNQPPLPDAIAPSPDIAPVREYKELFAMADENGDGNILSGWIKKGLSAMRKSAKEEGIDFVVYHTEHPGDIENALREEMKKSFAHVGKNLEWLEEEADIFARGLIQDIVDKALK